MPEPARECGACTVCCIVPGIDTREIQKRTGSVCRHCSGGGCAIYESRPKACREFFCAWMQDDRLGPDWRPDRSGVLAQTITIENCPGLSLMLIAEALKTVRQPWFVDFVFAQSRRGTPLVLALPGPEGTRSAKVLLNNSELQRAATPEQVRQVLRRNVRALMASEFEELVLLNSGNDVSSA
jgi:Fe-S-cluster containining protein